jgi:hypothetical protein
MRHRHGQRRRLLHHGGTSKFAGTNWTPGLLAISLGLTFNFADDHEQLRHGFVLYDALYSWSRHVRDEQHTWNPQRAGARSRVTTFPMVSGHAYHAATVLRDGRIYIPGGLTATGTPTISTLTIALTRR